MAVIENVPNTFRTRLGNDRGQAASMIDALNYHAWYAWWPGNDFPYQPGSGYGDMNDQWIAGPEGAYNTHVSLGRSSTVAQEAQKQSSRGLFWYALKKWWTGST